jgi:superfamily II DNA or RNA helicase
VFDDLVIGATLSDLIEQGYLSDFRAYASGHPDLSGVRTVAGDFHKGDLSAAMSKKGLTADVVATWLAHGDDRPTICFAVDRSHAGQLQQDFQRAGITAGYIDADTDVVERDFIKGEFIAGRIKVVCNCRTLTTGIDWPVGCIIDAAPTKSEMLHVQKIGRGLRVNEGIPDCIILDHADNSLRLGLVTDIHHSALSEGKSAQGKKAEKKPPMPRPCPSCAFLKPAGVHVCPECSFEPERKTLVPVEAGELVEITGKKRGPKQAPKAEKQVWWSALLAVRKERGFAKGWASHKYREKFGVWPMGLDDKTGPVPPEVRGFITAKIIAFSKQKQAGSQS